MEIPDNYCITTAVLIIAVSSFSLISNQSPKAFFFKIFLRRFIDDTYADSMTKLSKQTALERILFLVGPKDPKTSALATFFRVRFLVFHKATRQGSIPVKTLIKRFCKQCKDMSVHQFP